MKTIEQYEIEIQGKIDYIVRLLAEFEENLGRIGNIIGKDPTEVYKKLKHSFVITVESYKTSLTRNTAFFETINSALDNIITVLTEVHREIEHIETSRDEDMVRTGYSVNDTMENIAQNEVDKVVETAEGIATEVSKKTGLGQPTVLAIGSFILVKYVLGLSGIASIAAPVGVYYLTSKGKS